MVYLLPCNDHMIFFYTGLAFSTWNTVSNIFYILAGMIGIFLSTQGSEALVIGQTHLLVGKSKSIALYCGIILIGVASFLYHSTLQPWSISFDFVAIVLFHLFVLWCFPMFIRPIIFLGGSFLFLTTICVLLMINHTVANILYYLLITVLMGVVLGVIYDYRKRSPVKGRDFWISIGTLGLAFICFFIPKTLCHAYRFKHTFLQFHAFWHFFSSIGLFYCVRCISKLQHVSTTQLPQKKEIKKESSDSFDSFDSLRHSNIPSNNSTSSSKRRSTLQTIHEIKP